ncbi:MAG: type II secretion system protein [Campylobacterales bacterium]|nr:type II secretion system protein [Campylobacterales bacterium]
MKHHSFRKAFSLLTAIIVVILMSTVAMFIMSLSGKLVKETTAQYQREQAELYAKSYTEYAILAVTANDRVSSNCLRDIDGTIGDPLNGGYRIRARIAYIGQNTQVASCAATRVLSNSVTTIKSPLSIIVDVYVEYKEPDHPNSAQAPWITYHKRTLQKI